MVTACLLQLAAVILSEPVELLLFAVQLFAGPLVVVFLLTY